MKKDQGDQKDEHKDQQGRQRHMGHGDQTHDDQKHGDQKNDQGRQRQGGMGDEQDEELKRPVKAGQGDHRGQDEPRR